MNGFDTNRLPTFNGTVRSRFLLSLSKRDVGEKTMSNIATPNIVGRHRLVHCAAVALALSIAFVGVTMPKPDTAAASTTDNGSNSGANTAANTAACLQTWPYYERSCLRNTRQRDGDVRTVRVFAINGQARHHMSRQ
ncbi:MAG: hypothetical protein WBL55_10410 [Xanthobacteraceae bacterium]